MIVDAVLGIFFTLFEAVTALLPTGSFPIADTSEMGFVNFIYKLDYVMPFVEPLRWIVGVASASFAALLAYRLGLFIYTKVRG